MTDLEILKMNAQKIFDAIQGTGDTYEQIKSIKEILKDVQGDIQIETTVIGGLERITKVDVKPTQINLFQEFNCTSPHIDAEFLTLSRLYTAYLWCEKTGETQQLYDLLLRYEQVANYPITRCEKGDKSTLMAQASCIIDDTLGFDKQQSNPTLLSKIQDTFTALF